MLTVFSRHQYSPLRMRVEGNELESKLPLLHPESMAAITMQTMKRLRALVIHTH